MIPMTSPMTVYGSLMHHRVELQAMSEAAQQPPYNAPPKAPVLYIKPANTFNAFGHTLYLSAAQAQMLARTCVGLIYRPNQGIAGIESAHSAIKNIVIEDWQTSIFCDFTVPHNSFYRPPLRFNALDGSLALPQTTASWQPNDLRNARIETWVNCKCVHSYHTQDWMCSALEQLNAVSEFIAWEAGDVLLLGCPPDTPLVKVGDVVEARMNGHVFTRTRIAAQVTA